MNKRAVIVLCLVLLASSAAAFAHPAFAQRSAEGTYAGEAGVAAEVERGDGGAIRSAGGPGEPSAVAAQPSALPFTGAELALLGLGALVLVGAGAALAWATRRPERDF